nr:DNA-directed RNA polymerase V subunit 1 [Tanacetum cinerariifolium]
NVVSADHPKSIGRRATVDNAIDVRHVYLDKVGLRNPSKEQKVELTIDVVLEKEAVKKNGDVWRTIMDSCLPIMHLIDTTRSIPYAIKQVDFFWHSLLSTSVSAVTKGIMKEHLLLLATIMICAGMLVGFNQAGIKALSNALNCQALFSEATFFYATELHRKLRTSINQTGKGELRDMNGQSYQPSHMNFAPALQHQVQPSISPNDRSAFIKQPHYAYNNSSAAKQTTDPSNQPLDFGRRPYPSIPHVHPTGQRVLILTMSILAAFWVMVIPGFQLGDLHSTSIPYESCKTYEEPLNYTPLDENKMNSFEETHLQAPQETSVIEPTKVNKNMHALPDAIIIVNTQNVDT